VVVIIATNSAGSVNGTTTVSLGTLVTNASLQYSISDSITGSGGAQGIFSQTYVNTGNSTGITWQMGGFNSGSPTSPPTTYSTVVSGTTVYGPWVQINPTGNNLSLTQFQFWDYPDANGTGKSAPASITIAGSNNYSTWTTVYTISAASPYDYSLHTYNLTNIPFYTSYRFIFSTVNGNDAMYMKGINFTGYSNPASTGILSANTSLTYSISDSITGSTGAQSLFNQTYSNTGNSTGITWQMGGFNSGSPTSPPTTYSTVVSSTTVYGPWAQITLPSRYISLTQFQFWDYPDANGTGRSAPASITIAGSNNNSTWTTVYTISAASPYDYSLHTYNMSSIPYYKYIRFIFSTVNGNDAMYMKGILFSGYWL